MECRAGGKQLPMEPGPGPVPGRNTDGSLPGPSKVSLPSSHVQLPIQKNRELDIGEGSFDRCY